LRTIFEIVVDEEDIDHLGHVNYLKYITFSEQGVWDWHMKAGVSPDELVKRNLGTVIIKFDISYLMEARLGDTLKIITTPVQLGTKSFTFKQDIYNQNDVHITEFNKTFVMFDTSTRKSTPVIEEIICHFNVD
jgi:YbgC/YbaW family acyl-CoA thioester hydrolase